MTPRYSPPKVIARSIEKPRLVALGREGKVANNDPDLLTKIDAGQESQPASSAEFDSYRSLANSNIRIIVPKDVVPPFRFKAGGWEFSQSSAELGPAINARIAERGFFMFRVNEDQSGGGVELTDLPPRPQN